MYNTYYFMANMIQFIMTAADNFDDNRLSYIDPFWGRLSIFFSILGILHIFNVFMQ